MPFSDGFNFLDLSTYGWMEYAILGAGLVVLVLLLVVWPLCHRRKKKRVVKRVLAVTAQKLVYKSDDSETLIFEGSKVWFVNVNGKTELLNLVSGNQASLSGKLVYANKEVRRTEVFQDGSAISKNASVVREYTTFDFVSSDEVHLGKKVFITDALRDFLREEARVLREEEEAKRAKEDALAKKLKAKNDKKQAKLDEKQAKRDAKANMRKVKADAKAAKKVKEVEEVTEEVK